MSNNKITKFLALLATLSSVSGGASGAAHAFDNEEAKPNGNSRLTIQLPTEQNGTLKTQELGTGSVFAGNLGGKMSADGRLLIVRNCVVEAAKISADGNAGKIKFEDAVATGDEQNGGGISTAIDSGQVGQVIASGKIKMADAIDLLGKETFVDGELYLRTKDGKYLTTITKENGSWKNLKDEKVQGCLKVSKGVIKSQPDTNPFNIKFTYEYHCLSEKPFFYKLEDGKAYLANELGDYCDWKGKAVEDDKKIALENFKNYLTLNDDITSELEFKFAQGQKATSDGWSSLKNKSLSLVAVDAEVEDEKDGKKQMVTKTFLYSPADKKYLGKDGTMKDKPEKEDEITDDNLHRVWKITKLPAKQVKKMKGVAWKYNVHDKTWKMVSVYGGAAAILTAGLGTGAYAISKALPGAGHGKTIKNNSPEINKAGQPKGAF